MCKFFCILCNIFANSLDFIVIFATVSKEFVIDADNSIWKDNKLVEGPYFHNLAKKLGKRGSWIVSSFSFFSLMQKQGS